MATGVQTQTAEKTLPLTGAEYLESIRDDREIWIHGEAEMSLPLPAGVSSSELYFQGARMDAFGLSACNAR